MKCIAVFSSKGGTGKSTIARELAYMSATRSGRRTLLWDLDPQGASTFMIDRSIKAGATAGALLARETTIAKAAVPTSTANLDLLPADRSLRQVEVQLTELDRKKRLRRVVEAAAGSYDRIILDCPPTLGELTDQLQRAADLLLVPVVPSTLSFQAYQVLIDELAARDRQRTPILPVFSMVDRRRRMHQEMLAGHPEWLFVPSSSLLERMPSSRSTVTEQAPNSPVALALGVLWHRVEQMLVSTSAD